MVLLAIGDGRRPIQIEFCIMLSFYGCTCESKFKGKKGNWFTPIYTVKMSIFRRPYNKTCCNLEVVIPPGDRAHGDVHLSWVSHLPLPAKLIASHWKVLKFYSWNYSVSWFSFIWALLWLTGTTINPMTYSNSHFLPSRQPMRCWKMASNHVVTFSSQHP